MINRIKARYFEGLPKEVAALTGVSFSVALGFGIVAPVIPVFAKTFGVSAFQASAVVSVFAFMRFASATPSGWLVNRFGERTVLWIGLGIVAVSSALAGMAQDFTHLIILRGLGGTGSSMFTVSAMSLLLRIVDSDHRARASSTYQSGFLFGSLAGPAIGGLIVGWNIRAPFFFYALTLTVASCVAFFALPKGIGRPDPTDDRTQTEPVMTLRGAFKLREYWTALTYNVGTGITTFGMRNAILPLFVIEILHKPASWSSIGFLFTSITQVAFLLPAGRFADLRGRKPSMSIGAVVLVISMSTLWVSENVTMYLVHMALVGIGMAFLNSGAAAVIGDIVSGRKGGPVVAFYQMTSDFGMIIGPLLAGYLLDKTNSYHDPFGMSLLIAITVAVFVITMPETRHRKYAV
jgi:MFS family permease